MTYVESMRTPACQVGFGFGDGDGLNCGDGVYSICNINPITDNSPSHSHSQLAPPPPPSHNHTIQPIHRLLDPRLNHIPIGPALGKLQDLLGPKDADEAIRVGDHGGELLSVVGVNQVDLAELAQRAEVLQQVFVLEGGDECVVVVDVAAGRGGVSGGRGWDGMGGRMGG